MALTSNETTNAAEYIVPLKSKASTLKKILLWCLYIGVPLALLVVLCVIMKGYEGYAIGIFLIVMVPLYFCNLLPKMIIPYTKIYSEVSYEYVLKQGQFFVNKVLGSEASQFKKRKEFMPAFTVSQMDIIEPLREEHRKMIADGKFDVVYDAVADASCPDNYVAIYTNEQGQHCIVLFQNVKKMLKAMSFLNSNSTVTAPLTK